MGQIVLILLAIILVIAIIIQYKEFFIIVGVLGIAAYIAVKYFKKKKAAASKDDPEPGKTSETASRIPALIQRGVSGNQSHELPAVQVESAPTAKPETAVTPQPEPKPKNPRLEQFEKELSAIPRVDVVPSAPVAKRRLMDMPPYEFSNITRATRFDSIFPLVFLDVETTGLYPTKSEIVEISAIKFDYGMVPVSCFTTLCKPRKPIPEEVTKINHITNDMVVDSPEFCQVAPALTDYIRGCNVAGHNLEFDLRFIFAHGADFPEDKRLYDTLDLAHLTLKKSDVYNYKLDTLCSYYGIWREQAHRSLSDCYATSKVFSKLVFDKTSRRLELSEELELSY